MGLYVQAKSKDNHSLFNKRNGKEGHSRVKDSSRRIENDSQEKSIDSLVVSFSFVWVFQASCECEMIP